MQKLVFQMKMRVLITTFFSWIYLYPFASPDAQGDALYALKTSLNASSRQLMDWNINHVNPCTWSRIICDGDNNVTSVVLSDMRLSGTLSPRIGILKALETLQLQGNGITGIIPHEFGDLTSLTVLNLEDNHLSGEIPSSLGNLKNLAYLTLNENDLSGSVPESLSTLSNLMDIDLASNNLSGKVPEQLFKIPKYNFTGNHLNCDVNFPLRCDSENNGGSSKSRTGSILGCITGLVLLTLLGSLIAFFLCKKACKACRDDEVYFDVAGEVDQKIEFGQLKRFSWREIQIATDDFDETNVLGQGGFGKVYKGVLVDGTKVAVKRLMSSAQNPSGDAAFLREVELISFAVHRNILRLIGFCTTPNERLLVYPFMKNLSVASRLRDIKPGEPVLDWAVRKRVAMGTARGLEYLHEQCNPKIIHRDVKAANVLLDDGLEPVIGDFGLAKLVDARRTSITTQVRGTMGHIAPEYLSTGRSSEKTDVFGYGIMLLELVSGQRAVDFFRLDDQDEVLLLDHVARLQRERKLEAIVDPNLGDGFGDGEVETVIQIALLCTQLSPEDRPGMSEVVGMLEGEGLVEKWEEWEHVEVARRREYEMLQRRINWRDDGDSTFLQVAVELSGGR